MGKPNWDILNGPFALVNIISFKTRGESLPLQTDFRLCLSVWLFLWFVQICIKKKWGGGAIGPDHIVQLLRTPFCGCNQVMFQRNAAAWKSNQMILSDSNIVLLILKDVMILQFFSLVLTSHTLDHEPITVS